MNLFKTGPGLYLILVFISLSCEQIIEVNPPQNQLISATVFNSESSAISAVNGIYSKMMQGNAQFGSSALTLLPALSADEIYNTTPGAYSEFSDNAITSSNSMLRSNVWSQAYNFIYQANSVIEGIEKSTALASQTKSQLKGEGLFIRAFCHFYLVDLFGDVPLITSTNYLDNLTKPRAPKEEIYNRLISDLEMARTLLADDYPESERTRPNSSVVTALLSRVYLYSNMFEKAEQSANELLSTSNYQLENNPVDVFKQTSKETIWQLMPVQPGNNTWEGNLFIPFENVVPSYCVRPGISAAFELNDRRRDSWIVKTTANGTSYEYPAKYKVRASSTLTEYYVVFRLAEQYLIRAEARIRQGEIAEGISDLNTIRSRASNTAPNILTPINSSLTKEAALMAVLRERRIELFAEWGHRWFDLKRTANADSVLRAEKGNDIQPTDLLYPIPAIEIQRNTKLTQNEGY